MTESLKDHIKRRAGVIAERLELELTVAGTEYAPLERAVFKATKNNTKTPKEKHVLVLNKNIADGNYAKTVLKMLARRLKEVGAAGTSASNIAAGMKTLAVWHRCLNSGDSTFIALCSQYSHVLEPPTGNAMGQMYAAYLREVLNSYSCIKYAYHRETSFESSKITKVGTLEVVDHTPIIMAQLVRILECDLQGGLIDVKTRNAVQYCINMLIIDLMPLFNALDLAMTRIKDSIGQMEPEDAERLAAFYGKFAKMPEKILTLLKQVSFDRDASPPVTNFDRGTLKEFKTRVEKVNAKLKTDDHHPDTIKALAEVAKSEYESVVSQGIAKISMDEVETTQHKDPPKAAPAAPAAPAATVSTNLLDDLFDAPPAPAAAATIAAPAAAAKTEEWDPFGSPPAPAAAAATMPAAKPFNPFEDDMPAMGGGGGGGAAQNDPFGGDPFAAVSGGGGGDLMGGFGGG
eukprot:CAMPEP_0177697420 /NCGR_PEP_ID=MMETSP0484_2-20121128/4504_1 /TAXON_ID=354590 /ORGANISM="Rhodomonas lens, Strain RHODO" /LENGTH=459 /DNA_ID=CAMNT_0019208457 /DNA_START=32 /DNA_END=1407 /DNA_ORIENTATION=-